MTVDWRPAIPGATVFALKCLLLWLALTFGIVGSAFSQASDPRLRRDLPKATVEPRQDILILRSGGHEEGQLMGCSAQSCSLEGKSHRREDIVLIGLGIGTNDPPPAIDDPFQDLIQLRNAAPLKTKLLGINAQTVVSEHGSHLRSAVAWVYLASPPPPPPSAANQARQSPPPLPSSTPRPPNYVWQGWIEVDNSFAGVTIRNDVHGRHKWNGFHRLKFVERWTDRPSSISDSSGRSFKLQEVVPLELNYKIQADHHHDYDHRWGDTVLHGTASGNIAPPALARVFLGEIVRFESRAAPPVPYRQPQSFGSWRQFREFIGSFEGSRRAGCYRLSIGFIIGQPVAERRALYRGINRTGSSPIHPDPDQDFLRVMVSHMPDGTNVFGCLEEPDQREVKGEFTYPHPDPGPLNNPETIKIRWLFNRCREGVECPPVPEPASASSNSNDRQAGAPPQGGASPSPAPPAAAPPAKTSPAPTAPRGSGGGFMRP